MVAEADTLGLETAFPVVTTRDVVLFIMVGVSVTGTGFVCVWLFPVRFIMDLAGCKFNLYFFSVSDRLFDPVSLSFIFDKDCECSCRPLSGDKGDMGDTGDSSGELTNIVTGEAGEWDWVEWGEWDVEDSSEFLELL